MQNDFSQTPSLWIKTAEPLSFPPLSADTETDVCVIGAGIAGLTTAYLLAREGLGVLVVESAGAIAAGETGRTTAHLSFALDDRYSEIERLFGEDGAKLAAHSHSTAVDQIQSIVESEGILCAFERLDGYLFEGPGEATGILHREYEAARRAGISDCSLISRAPLHSFDTGPCLKFQRQAQFHPVAYLNHLTRAFLKYGGSIACGCHAEDIDSKNSPHRVVLRHGPNIWARSVVVCTNTPVNDIVTMHTKQAPYRTYAIAARIPPGSVPKALYWDTLDPYHYVRLQDNYLIAGGEDHKTGQDQYNHDRFDALVAWTIQRFPIFTDDIVLWSGQVMEPIDGLGFIGRNPGDSPDIYIATGDSGHGMTHGTIAGMLIRDLILDRDNPWAALYDPARKTLGAAGEFLKENLNVAAQYFDYVRKGVSIESADTLGPGQAAIIARDGRRIAAYKDHQGRTHEVSAVCTHLECLVSWNAVERSWDCPCHGSRFDVDGNVLNGPAVAPLENMKVNA
jgi:glycine/D-amino acid oxidase-like deaminating enzyme/nitrite reductase/ring-hydroxylating ferredoxin subunit